LQILSEDSQNLPPDDADTPAVPFTGDVTTTSAVLSCLDGREAGGKNCQTPI